MTSLNTQTPADIHVTEADFEILSNLAEHIGDRTPGGRILAGELARAVIVEPDEAPRPFARIGSTVRYEDLTSGQTRQVRLSLPRDASIDDNRIAVTTPVGAALIGLSAGESCRWTETDGRQRGVRVLYLPA